MKHKFRIKEACRIAGVSRDRLNEAVAAGNYPCAPPVRRGATRVFDEADMIVLFIYGRMLHDNYLPSVAGMMACEVRECFLGMEEGDDIILARTSGGLYSAFPKSHVDAGDVPVIESNECFWSTRFNIAGIRAVIRREAEEEMSIIGTDSED